MVMEQSEGGEYAGAVREGLTEADIYSICRAMRTGQSYEDAVLSLGKPIAQAAVDGWREAIIARVKAGPKGPTLPDKPVQKQAAVQPADSAGSDVGAVKAKRHYNRKPKVAT